ncbi:MAG TPA: hypothetical protein VFN37_06480, partial [Candidatus Baltobacteraceae bacterium]|nr:hypothetical protein [Candidatus Baltobacteraceae bacterium]
MMIITLDDELCYNPARMALPVGVGIVADRRTTAAALGEIIESDAELLLIAISGPGSDAYD